MKKQNSNSLQNKKTQKLFVVIFFMFCFFVTHAQSVTINFPQNNLYTGIGGTLVYDILHANGKIFAYSSDGVSIYQNSNNQFITKILFDETDLFYGKFNPVYFNSRLAVPDQNLMVYNNGINNKYVYILTPKLKLLIIDAVNNNYWISSLRVSKDVETYLDQALSSQSGRSILRFDNDTNNPRLYILVSGRNDTINCTGSFHVMKTVFGIYDIDYSFLPNVNNHFNLHYVEINEGDINVYGNQINNFVFNEENNCSNGKNNDGDDDQLIY